ncbi:MAG: hypothetical protein JNM21_14560 [Taibaiella sp.]|nr:hypothetical protein [Taibaiella sp.]
MKPFETPTYNLTSNQLVKEEVIDHDFRQMVGDRMNHSLNENAIAFSFQENAIDNDEFIEKMSIEFKITTTQIETFLLFLWFVKDNSISLEEAYGQFTNAKSFIWYTGNTVCSTCDGKFIKTTFTDDEIFQAVDLLLKYTKNIYGESGIPSQQESFTNNKKYETRFRPSVDPSKDENRIERALTFLNTARSVPHLPQKITQYMSILECLFSINSNKIVHNITERVAYYLEETSVKKTIKEAYDIRSRFVHGNKMKKQHDYICNIARDVDKIVRSILKKIIVSDYEIFSQNNLGPFLKNLNSKK